MVVGEASGADAMNWCITLLIRHVDQQVPRGAGT